MFGYSCVDINKLLLLYTAGNLCLLQLVHWENGTLPVTWTVQQGVLVAVAAQRVSVENVLMDGMEIIVIWSALVGVRNVASAQANVPVVLQAGMVARGVINNVGKDVKMDNATYVEVIVHAFLDGAIVEKDHIAARVEVTVLYVIAQDAQHVTLDIMGMLVAIHVITTVQMAVQNLMVNAMAVKTINMVIDVGTTVEHIVVSVIRIQAVLYVRRDIGAPDVSQYVVTDVRMEPATRPMVTVHVKPTGWAIGVISA